MRKWIFGVLDRACALTRQMENSFRSGSKGQFYITCCHIELWLRYPIVCAGRYHLLDSAPLAFYDTIVFMANNSNGITALVSQTPAEDIKALILAIRGRQVLLDSDVARLYGYEVKRINETARRNIQRFPEHFRFQLTQDELDEVLRSQIAIANGNKTDSAILRSQIATLKTGQGQHRKYLPYVYTEQGIGMLSGLLKNSTAVQVSIGIMNAFVEMREFISANRDVFANIANINHRLLEHDGRLTEQGAKIDEILTLLETPKTAKQFIFYKGQFYDAFKLVIGLVKQAKSSITIIDNYIDNSVLEILENKRNGVAVMIITAKSSRLSQQHLQKFSAQHGSIAVVESKDFHDRFILLDDKEVYALGASIKDLGNKCFEISKNEDTKQFIAYVNNIPTNTNTATF
jgi:hypothetical protein